MPPPCCLVAGMLARNQWARLDAGCLGFPVFRQLLTRFPSSSLLPPCSYAALPTQILRNQKPCSEGHQITSPNYETLNYRGKSEFREPCL
jgi:hypothetical protein